MTNPYQPPTREMETDDESRPLWQTAVVGWIVGLILSAPVAFALFPWLHALLLTAMGGAAVAAIIQVPILLRELRRRV